MIKVKIDSLEKLIQSDLTLQQFSHKDTIPYRENPTKQTNLEERETNYNAISKRKYSLMIHPNNMSTSTSQSNHGNYSRTK